MKEPVKCLVASFAIGLLAPILVLAYEYVIYAIYETLQAKLGSAFWIAPRIGAGLTLIVTYRLTLEKVSTEGIIRSLYAGEEIDLKAAPLVILGSITTIGFGLSAGTAGPLVFLGASIGLLVARLCDIGALRRNAMILVGAAAMLAAHVSSPMAATLFVFEVIAVGVMVERDAIFVAVSSATSTAIASLISTWLHLVRAYTRIPAEIPPIALSTLLLVILAGVFSGLFSAFIVYLFEALFVLSKRVPIRHKLFFAAAITSLVYFLSPSVLSPRIPTHEGPEAIIYALLKPMLTAITLVLGGVGGTFMPTIASAIAFGEFLDYLFSVNFLVPIVLAAVFGAASRCPLASILLALEMFEMDPRLTPRLVLGTTLSMIVHTLIAGDLSLYSLSIVSSRMRVRSFYLDPRRCLRVADVMKPIKPVPRYEHIAKALYIMHEKRVHALPIVNDVGELIGIVTLGDFKRAFLMGVSLQPDDPVRKISPKRKPITIRPEATIEEALRIMDKHGIDHLIVVKDGKILGVLSRDDVLSVYRKHVIDSGTLRTPRRPLLSHKFFSLNPQRARFLPHRSKGL